MYSEGVTYPCAIVDGIEYPIDKYSIFGKTNLHREMLDYGFCMEFGVGDLSLTANRDHLHYDDATTNKILEKINYIADEIKDRIITSIYSAPSYFEACTLYRNIKRNIGEIVSNLGPITWNGHKLRVTCNIKDIGKWAKIIGYSVNGTQVLVERSNENIYFNDPMVMLIHNDKTNFINKQAILWLSNENKDTKTIQVIYTPDIPSSADFKEAIDRYGHGSEGVEVKYDTALLDLLQPIKFSNIQIPKAKYLPKACGVSRAILEDGNINGYNLYIEYSRRSGRKIKANAAQFSRDDGGIYAVYDYKNRNVLSEGTPLTDEAFVMAKRILNEDIIIEQQFRTEIKQIGFH